jgi:acetyltransferase
MSGLIARWRQHAQVTQERVEGLLRQLDVSDMSDERLPRPAIRPYPGQYVTSWRAKDGSTVNIRPIRPEDEPLLVRFHETLSELTVYQRYLHVLKLDQRVAHERLARLCFIDYDREMALIAERTDPRSGAQVVIAVGRLIKQHGMPEAEFALLVTDSAQRQGLGTELVRCLLRVAREEKLLRLTADILPENRAMQRICEKLGFRLDLSPEERLVKALIEL